MTLSNQIDEASLETGWRLSSQHQLAIAFLGAAALVAVGGMYAWSVFEGDQGDVDQASSVTRTFQVDVNHAEVGELVAVPNVGPKMAQAIVDYREQQGQLQSVEELQNISGMGPVKLEQLKKYVLPIK